MIKKSYLQLPVHRHRGCVILDWGNTLMRIFPGFQGPMAAWPQVETLPGVRETLLELRERGWYLVLATNSEDSDEEEIWVALRRGGLADLIERVYCSRRIGHRKPDKAFFDYILADIGFDRSKVVMIGDDYEADVRGATAAGINAIWVKDSPVEHGI